MAEEGEVKGKVPEEVVEKIREGDPLTKDTNTGVDNRSGAVPPDRAATTSGASGGGSKDAGGNKGKS